MSELQLNVTLGHFISEVRNVKGEDYRGNTLYEILISIQHFLKENGRYVNFLESEAFTWMRKVLDAKMKDLAKKGVGINKRQASVISNEQEDELWQKGILGTDTPQKLLDALLYVLGLNMALRAGAEHRNFRVGPSSQIKVCSSNGKKYLLYTEDVSKTNAGGLQYRKLKPKITRVYENTENLQRCPVNIYELYMSLRPKNGVCNALYLRPLKYQSPQVWYADSPVGIHQLTQTIARLCKEAGFEGFYTNHSLRATAATRLYAAGIDEQLITEKKQVTDHQLYVLTKELATIKGKSSIILYKQSNGTKKMKTRQQIVLNQRHVELNLVRSSTLKRTM